MNHLMLVVLLMSLTSCNLFGGMDTPRGNAQLLAAARACMDKEDYICARDYYQSISNEWGDVKLSEQAFVDLAEAKIFYMTDLITALGTGTGSGASIVTLANILASRQTATAANRLKIQTIYSNAGSIIDPNLRNYTQFIAATVMLASVLAAGVDGDRILTAADLAASPAACKADGTAGCLVSANCDRPVAHPLVNEDAAEATALSAAANWNTEPSISKITFSATATESAISALTGSGGLFSALNALGSLGGGSTVGLSRCSRLTLLNQLFP